MINKIAYLEKIKKPLKIKKIKFDNYLNDYQVLVKINYSGICRSQLMEIDGMRSSKKYIPHCLGHEATGIVINVGTKVSKVKKSDNVLLTWLKCSGGDGGSGKIESFGKKINYGSITTFSNYSIISENKLVKVPKSFNKRLGVFYGCAALTGAGMVLNQTKPKPKKNNKILLIGLGGIGLYVLFALMYLKIKNVYVLDTDKNKNKILKKLNSNYHFISNVNELSNHKLKFDICYDSSGSTNGIETAFEMIKDKGKVIFASHPSEDSKIQINPHDLIKGKKIIGSWGGACKPDIDVMKFYKIFSDDKFNIDKLTSTYNLNEINKAISDFRNGKTLRPIIKC